MENSEVARTLVEMADLLELTGGSPFKVRAYRQAGALLDTLPVPVAQLLAEDKLDELPGVGEHIQQHISDLITQGTFAEYEAVKRKVPEGVLELLQVEGVGPKTALAVWKKLKVTTVEGLEQVCVDGSLEELPRMGPARVKAILAALARYRARKGRVLLHRALPVAEALLQRLRKVRGVERAEAAGSLRRRKETVGDLDLLVGSNDPEPVMRAFAQAPDVAEVAAHGPTRSTARLHGGMQVDLRVVAPDTFGAAMHYFTGSKAHNIALRKRAVRRGLKVSEYGVFDREGKRLGGGDEQDVFALVGLPWIPPELREGLGELEAAEAGTLPKLVELEDLRGDLHVHSEASSDAHSSVEALAKCAERLGRQYLCITDHTRSRPLGLDAEALKQHVAGIRRLAHQRHGKLRLLAGAEVDVLRDGSLDLPAEVLRELDWVVGGIHLHLTDSRAVMTERMIRALRSGVIRVLAHPSGRQLGTRDAYDYDLEAVLEVAKETGVALELNAQPDRLDLPDRACRVAKEAGVPVVISTDAHHESQLENLRYGVWMARRGWLEASDVLNTRPWPALERPSGRPRPRRRTRTAARPARVS